MNLLKGIKKVLADSIDTWFALRAYSKAAALAFYTLFSITPIMVVSIAVASYFFGDETARGQIFHQLNFVLGNNVAETIQSILKHARHHGHNVVTTIVATIVFFLAATSALTELKESLDEIWGIRVPRNMVFHIYLKTQILSFIFVMLLSALLLVSLMLNAGFTYLEAGVLSNHAHTLRLLDLLSSFTGFMITALLFGFIYKTFPGARVAWTDVILGALFTTLFYSIGKYFITIYLKNSVIATGFGAAGSVVAMLLWMYYSALIFFFGAIFSRHYAVVFGSVHKAQLARITGKQ